MVPKSDLSVNTINVNLKLFPDSGIAPCTKIQRLGNLNTYALSFHRSQNVLSWSKIVQEQKFIYILWQSQTFCARLKDDLHSVKLVFVLAQKFLKRH